MAVIGHPQKKIGLSNAFDASNKHVVFVKLTDSSLEALQNYIRKGNTKSSSWKKPTIQFSNNSGTFTVPISNEDGSTTLQQQKFTFSLSSIEEQNGPQGSFECLESKRPGSLESLGPIKDKIQVQASDESYTRFGERMSAVKKENEERTTRYLDKTSNGLVNSSHKIVSRKHILAGKSSTNRVNVMNRYSDTHGGSSAMSSNHHHHHRGPPPLHPMLDRNMAKHKRAQTNSEIMKRPLRERIVHLLAVRPYKKPELLDRITRDGLREKEKKDLFSTVKQVSMMKDNTYHLQRHIWNDVSEDWPFYTEEERQQFRRRKPQNLTPPGSDGSTGSAASGHSSSSSHPASPQPTLPLKRPASSSYLAVPSGDASPLIDHHHHLESGYSPPGGKKKRVSNYRRPAGLSPMSNSRSPNPMLTSGPHEDIMSGECKTNAWLKTNQDSASVSMAAASTAGLANSSSFSPSRMNPMTNGDIAMSTISMQSSNSSSSSRFSTADFLTKFVKIANSDQRRQYKSEFNKDYKRYMVLHGQLDRVSKKFERLQSQFSHTPKTSPEYHRLKAAVVQEYKVTKNSQFQRVRDEFQYLHKKLEHIKQLVHDYDTRFDTKSLSQQPRSLTASS